MLPASFLLIQPPASGVWTPVQLTTALWLDASDSSTLFGSDIGGSPSSTDGAVGRWEDKSGNAQHFSQATIGNRPIRKVGQQNGLDAVQFDGVNDFMGGSFNLLNEASSTGNIFVVCRTITGSNRGLISTRDSGGWSFRLNSQTELFYYHTARTPTITATVPNQVNIYEMARSGLSARIGSNGVFGAETVISGYTPESSATVVIGAEVGGTNSRLNSSLCEIIATETLLSLLDRQKTEGYLAHRWGLTSSLPADHPYKSELPLT